MDFDTSELTVQAWDIERPQDAPNNNKIHTAEDSAKLAKSMNKVGQISPLIVDKDGVIIAGHGRRDAARLLGWKKIKVIQLNVDRETAIRMRLADNLMSTQNFDQDAIQKELLELGEFEMDELVIDEKFGDLLAGQLSEGLGFDENTLSENIADDVSAFSDETDEHMTAAENEDTPLRKAFGFDKLLPAEALRVKRFMAQCVEETGESDPKNAFISWIEENAA